EHEQALCQAPDAREPQLVTHQLQWCGSRPQQQAVEITALNEMRAEHVEPPRRGVGQRKGDVHRRIKKGNLRQGPICKVREASKEGPYADELDNRGEKLPERQQHERCRVLHLRSERSGSVASIEATSIHLQPPCTFTRRMVRARSKRPNPM